MISSPSRNFLPSYKIYHVSDFMCKSIKKKMRQALGDHISKEERGGVVGGVHLYTKH